MMRRADRHSQIVQHLRGGRLVTAQKLGQWLEVSERTIYRDIADLQSTGVPIDGEAGVGYLMRERLVRTARVDQGAQSLGN
jgi:predicted DNA-binding transcriptional regulator YafY